jgi:hypothetical protein
MNPWGGGEDGGGGAEGSGEDGVAPASLNGMRRSEKAKVLEKA